MRSLTAADGTGCAKWRVQAFVPGRGENVGLSGKTDHYVGAQGQVRSGGAHKSLNFFRVVPWAIAAMHAAQDGIRAGLERQMDVAGEAGSAEVGHQSDEFGVPVHRLNGTET